MMIFSKVNLAFSSLWYSFLMILPDEFSKFRIRYFNSRGANIHPNTAISPNVRIRGRFELGEGSSIGQNSSISGEKLAFL